MNLKHTFGLVIACLLSSTMMAQTQSNKMVIQANKIGAPIQPTMYGLFFEDINYAADGGLYAELVKNRSFEFPQHLMGWNTFGNVKVMDNGPFENNPYYVQLSPANHPHLHTGLENEGFFGMGIKQGEEYRFSVWARGENQKIRVDLVKSDRREDRQHHTSATIEINSKEWKQYEVILTSPATDAKARLRIFLETKGTVDLEHISLFPVDTWKGHKNGLRKDLAQALYDIKPGVFRFPGGCVVEGTTLETRYNWKNSVGPVENRKLNENRWNTTFKNRLYPDYFQSYGLGFYEYFLLSEELGAEPLPIVNCGLSCQYQNQNAEAHVALCDLDEYIQDALDLVEFANGDTSTKWGKLRTEMGHPAPFNLKYIGIGNEQWGEEYTSRLKQFVTVFRQTYPDIMIIGSSGPYSQGDDFNYLWPEMKKLKVDLVDEHFYNNEDWFLSQGSRYDNYDRKGPKVFAGEYACHIKKKKYNHFYPALLEAALMTGFERNADVVHMATYAPLFAHVEGWQWRPDMIWFDNLNSVRTCSYYVQQLYGNNKGTNVVPLTMDKKAVSGQEGQNGLFASAVWDKDTNSYIVKVANVSDETQPLSLIFNGIKKGKRLVGGECITLSAEDGEQENTIEHPNEVTPLTHTFEMTSNLFDTDIAAKTFKLYRFKLD